MPETIISLKDIAVSYDGEQVLNGFDPASVGGKLPDEGFYYNVG